MPVLWAAPLLLSIPTTTSTDTTPPTAVSSSSTLTDAYSSASSSLFLVSLVKGTLHHLLWPCAVDVVWGRRNRSSDDGCHQSDHQRQQQEHWGQCQRVLEDVIKIATSWEAVSTWYDSISNNRTRHGHDGDDLLSSDHHRDREHLLRYLSSCTLWDLCVNYNSINKSTPSNYHSHPIIALLTATVEGRHRHHDDDLCRVGLLWLAWAMEVSITAGKAGAAGGCESTCRSTVTDITGWSLDGSRGGR